MGKNVKTEAGKRNHHCWVCYLVQTSFRRIIKWERSCHSFGVVHNDTHSHRVQACRLTGSCRAQAAGCFVQLINGVGPLEMAEMLKEENVSQ